MKMVRKQVRKKLFDYLKLNEKKIHEIVFD